jgi:hypothetical protein
MWGRHVSSNELAAWNADALGTRRAQNFTSIIIYNRDDKLDITTSGGKIKGRIRNKGADIIDYKTLGLRPNGHQ